MEPCDIDLGGVKQISHTADIGLIARADSLEGLFSLCGTGLVEVIVGRSIEQFIGDLEQNSVKRIKLVQKITGFDLENLLITFLTEILYRLEAENLLVISSQLNLRVEENELNVSFECIEYDPERQGYFREVKAVTYHRLSIVNCNDGTWAARVILDI